MTQTPFRKRYASAEACSTAVANYSWLLGAAEPLTLPAIRSTGTHQIDFEHVEGRHLDADVLPAYAAHLGKAHAAAWAAELRRARLDEAHCRPEAQPIPDFISPRAERVGPAALAEVARGPVAFYKDANIRNTLVTAAGELVTVDFDSLTLAPFGYDLAKCVVSLTMTSGPLTWTQIRSAWSLYNTAASECDRALGGTSWPAFLAMADIHALLTEPYLGRNGYIHPWRRPAHATEEQS